MAAYESSKLSREIHETETPSLPKSRAPSPSRGSPADSSHPRLRNGMSNAVVKTASALNDASDMGNGSTNSECRCHGRGGRAGWSTKSRASGGGLVLLLGATLLLMLQRDGPLPIGDASGLDAAAFSGMDGEDSFLGLAASSSSMWDLDGDRQDEPAAWTPAVDRRRLLFMRDERTVQLRGANTKLNPIARPKPPGTPKKMSGEPAMLYEFKKAPLDYLDLDDVQEGWLWIPVAIDKFDPLSEDPLVKMCQVNYKKYSDAPWLLPMGGLLAINSGCADIERDTVQLVRISVLEKLLKGGKVPVSRPTGFIFHETRCGSTLVANMLASVERNVMWSESTGPWKVMHTCPKCEKRQIVRYLKVIIDAMSRSPHHEHFFFKFQSSEDIDAVTTAFPDVPWIFIFREPVEVMMSRLGAQRIGMEGMEKEVAARVEKGMTQGQQGLRGKLKGKVAKEVNTAKQLSALCQKAIQAFEANPDQGMMVEYPHLPDGIVNIVLPRHFQVKVLKEDYDRMMTTTQKYSKVATYQKAETPESKFIEDTSTKHDAASVAVTEAAQQFLYPDYYRLKSLETWNSYQTDLN